MQSKLTLLASAAVLTLGLAGQANAGPMGHFAGFNAGIDIGWANVFGQIDDVNPNYANNSGFQDVDSTDGFLLGGHLGYDWQFDNSWLVGLEATVQSISAETAECAAAGCANYQSNGNGALSYDMKGTATIRGRVGFIITPDMMIYGAAGFAIAEVTTNHHDSDQGDGDTRQFTGYSLGAGIQRSVSSNADLRLDVTYDHFGSEHWIDHFSEAFGAEPELVTVSLGAVWHLN